MALKLGATSAAAVKLGGQTVTKIYLGTNVVYAA